MGPGASGNRSVKDRRRTSSGIIWPSVVAILFATFAAISFAVDQTVSIAAFPDLEQMP
jgi:hypothetical protein